MGLPLSLHSLTNQEGQGVGGLPLSRQLTNGRILCPLINLCSQQTLENVFEKALGDHMPTLKTVQYGWHRSA